MIKVSDYIAQSLVEHGVKHVFMVTGGGAMHLNDSFGKNPYLEYVCFHHEQACAMAAESYARLTGRIAAVNVTTGPGGINALNGVFGSWTDSVPMIVISGQVRYDTTVHSTGLKLRQLGDQEFAEIVTCAKTITKYAVMVIDPGEIRYHLERALFLAKTGRPGPTWIDIPLNVQSAVVNPETLHIYDPVEDSKEFPPRVTHELIIKIIELIKSAKRPVLMVGSGIWIANAHKTFLKVVELLRIPVVTGFNAHDLITHDHPANFGRPGTIGDRPGNFIVQNSDLVLILGCRLNIRQIGYNWKTFARAAFKILVDIDPLELKKPTVDINLPIYADVSDFLSIMLQELPKEGLSEKKEWLEWCRIRKERYPVVLKEYWKRSELVNSYCFVEALSEKLQEDQVIVTGNGSACNCTFQALKIKKGQRLYSNSGSASMGYDLPAAIGASLANNRKKIVCITGDGSIQMNLQELQTIVHYGLPIKIFVMNNNGYHSIRQTQENFFVPPLVGCDPDSGISFPDMQKIAYVYDIPFIRCKNHSQLDDCISVTLRDDCPFICEIMVTPNQTFAPKASSKKLPDGKIVSKPLEDLFPFLDRKELEENMIIDLIPEE